MLCDETILTDCYLKSPDPIRWLLCDCFFRLGAHGGEMSLNRWEQRLFDYLQSHLDERHHWQGKFQRVAKETVDEHFAILQIEPELWRYYVERSEVTEPFKSAAHHEGLRRTSMKNLAELLMRLWTEPRPKKPAAGSAESFSASG